MDSNLISVSYRWRPLPRPWVFASMISLMRPAPTLFFAASLTLYQVPQRRFSSLKERSVELMNTSFHSSVLSTEYWSTKPARRKRTTMKKKERKETIEDLRAVETLVLELTLVPSLATRGQYHTALLCSVAQIGSWLEDGVSAAISYLQCAKLRACWLSCYGNEVVQCGDSFI